MTPNQRVNTDAQTAAYRPPFARRLRASSLACSTGSGTD